MKTLSEMFAVMKAAEDGKQIQRKAIPSGCQWLDTPHPNWNWESFDYRVKPEPRIWRGHVTLDGGFISCDHENCTAAMIEVVEVMK